MNQFFCVVCYCPKIKSPSELLCKFCLDKVESCKFKVHCRKERDVPHFYLFKWNKQSDVFCRSLIYFLKNKSTSFFLEWALRFESSYFLDVKTALVPSCSDKTGLNHAYSFAEAFLKQKRLERVLEVNVRTETDLEQKVKNREERLKTHKKDFGQVKYTKDWIFVDDVLVSGGTFKAVSESMFTKPQALFTLFYRSNLENKGFYDG